MVVCVTCLCVYHYHYHYHQVLHRDVKSENIMLDADDLPKLCVFETARQTTS